MANSVDPDEMAHVCISIYFVLQGGKCKLLVHHIQPDYCTVHRFFNISGCSNISTYKKNKSTFKKKD